MSTKRNITYIIGTIIFSVLVIPLITTAQQSADVYLGGHRMQPKVQTSGSGMVTVTLKNDSLTVEGDFEYLTGNYSGAYIMLDIKGQTGNQLFSLTADLNENKKGGVFRADANRFALSKSERQLLKKGELFIVVTSFDHQAGEIRGDIPAMGGK